MKVLVTGLDGFTGRYVQAELEKNGHQVVGLVSDLTDYDALSVEINDIQPQAVIHLAATTFVGHDNANTFYEVNLIGTRNLLANLAQHVPKVRSVLLTSSANVYGNQSKGILREDTIPAPANDYAISKVAMEQMAHLWVDKLPLFIVRPFNYTGVGQDEKFVVPKIVAHFKDKRPIVELGNLDVLREFGDVRAVADTYRKLLEICPVGETLNVCTGQPHSLREIIALCEKVTGYSIQIKVNPEFVRENEVRALMGDNSRLKALITDFQPYNLEDTLIWMLQETRLT